MKSPVYLFAYLTLLTLFSCQTPAKRLDDLTPTSREMTIGSIAIEVPTQDTIVNTPGVDSYVTRIITSKKDTFEMEKKLELVTHSYDLYFLISCQRWS